MALPGLTTNLPRGRTSLLRLADQPDFLTPAPDTFFELNTYTGVFNKKRPLQDDDVNGQVGYANNTDDRPAAPGLEDADGSLQVPLDLDQLGFWLRGAFPTYAKAAAGGATAHTFTSGGPSLPYRTLERVFGAAQFESLLSAVVTEISLPIGASQGYAKADLSLWGRQVSDPYNASIAGAPTVVPLASRVPASSGVIMVGGAALGRILSGTLKLTSQVDADRYAGDNLQSDAYLVKQSLSLDIQARYTTDAIRALGVTAAGTTLPAVLGVQLSWTLNANLKLVVTAPAMRFNPVGVNIQNGGVIQQQLTGRGEVGAGAAMLTAVLTNGRATY